jgi:hypothetical protein
MTEDNWQTTYGSISVEGNKLERAQGVGRFPEIKGLCRTCEHALISRRAYEEVPRIKCMYQSEPGSPTAGRMPLDVMECTLYRRRGEMDLRDMAIIALKIDPRDPGGQYL